MNGLGKPCLGPMEGSQIQPMFALDDFPDHRSIGNDGSHRILDNPQVDLHQLGCMLDHTRLWVADVTLGSKVLERVLDGGPCPVGAVADRCPDLAASSSAVLKPIPRMSSASRYGFSLILAMDSWP